MNMESISSVQTKENAVRFRLAESAYFQEAVQDIFYKMEGQLSLDSDYNCVGLRQDWSFYIDAFVTALDSCFDLLLQVVNLSLRLGFSEESIMWKLDGPFCSQFEKANQQLYVLMKMHKEDINSTSLWWLRNEISHRDSQGFVAGHIDGHVSRLSFVFPNKITIKGKDIYIQPSPIEIVPVQCEKWLHHRRDFCMKVLSFLHNQE